MISWKPSNVFILPEHSFGLNPIFSIPKVFKTHIFLNAPIFGSQESHDAQNLPAPCGPYFKIACFLERLQYLPEGMTKKNIFHVPNVQPSGVAVQIFYLLNVCIKNRITAPSSRPCNAKVKHLNSLRKKKSIFLLKVKEKCLRMKHDQWLLLVFPYDVKCKSKNQDWKILP